MSAPSSLLLFALVLCGILSLSAAQLWGFGTVAPVEEKTTPLDQMENALSRAHEAVVAALPLFKAAAALALLQQGDKLVNTVLVIQALRITGLDGIKKSLAELAAAYRRGRATLRAEMPALLAAKKELESFPAKMQKLRADAAVIASNLDKSLRELRVLKIEPAKLAAERARLVAAMEKDKAKVLAEMESLRVTKKKVDAASSALKTVVASVEPEHLQATLVHSWSSLLAVVSVAKSKTAASVSMGISLGSTAFDVVRKLLPPHLMTKSGGGATWLGGAVNGALSSLGVMLSFALSKAAVTLTACTLGSEMLTHALVEAVETHLGVKMPRAAATAVQTAVTSLALAKHLAALPFQAAAAAGVGGAAGDKAPVRSPRMSFHMPFFLVEEFIAKKLI